MKSNLNVSNEDKTSIYSRWLDNPHLNDVNPISIGWHSRAKGAFFGPGVRDVFIFQYVISGKGIYRVDGVTYNLSKGDLFLIRPNETIYYQADYYNPYTYVYIDFNGKLVKDLLEYSGFNKNKYVQNIPELFSIFDFIKINTTSNFAQDIEFSVKLYEIFSVLYQNNKGNAEIRSLPKIHTKQAIDYIHINYMQDIYVNDISDALGLDKRYLSRIFKENIGTSPKEYLINYRLEKAKNLLQSQNISINEVSRSVGYSDAFTFSKMYKKKYGISPSEQRISK